jgi:hypothetical protein
MRDEFRVPTGHIHAAVDGQLDAAETGAAADPRQWLASQATRQHVFEERRILTGRRKQFTSFLAISDEAAGAQSLRDRIECGGAAMSWFRNGTFWRRLPMHWVSRCLSREYSRVMTSSDCGLVGHHLNRRGKELDFLIDRL